MSFPQERIITAKQLVQMYKESSDTQRFCFILGAGASVESGIKDGKELEMRWMEEIVGDRDGYEDFLKTAKDLFDNKKIDHSFDEIREEWEAAKEKGKRLSSEYYFDLYKLRYYLNPKNGYHFLEDLMDDKDPSVGYHVLAKLLTQDKKSNNLVITTNFDSLVEDSLFLYTDKKPLVAGHEALAVYIDSNARRPVVAKVHRGLMFDPFNSTEEISQLQPQWEDALRTAFNIYTPIVIGYAGGDQSLMAFLKNDSTKLQNGVYWCYLEKSGLPDDKILEFVEKNKGFLVAIDGFDSLMLTFGGIMFPTEISPGGTKEYLDKQVNRRMENYSKKYAEAAKKPENREVVQPIEAAQQAGEEQREKENALTAWDYILRGNRLFDEGNYPAAIKECEQAIKKAPNLAVAYYNRGLSYKNCGQYDKAMEDYTKAVKLDPKYAAAYNNRGVLYGEKEQYKKAIRDFSKALELDLRHTKAYNNRGKTYNALRKYEEAIEDLSKAIELEPEYVFAYHNRGCSYHYLEQYEAAIEDYTKAIELDPKYADAYYNRGIAYRNLENYEDAIADYTKAIELDPKYADAYYNRGIAYLNLKKYEEAIADYTKAIELDPNDAAAYGNRAIAYRAIGEITLAEADEEMARKLK